MKINFDAKIIVDTKEFDNYPPTLSLAKDIIDKFDVSYEFIMPTYGDAKPVLIIKERGNAKKQT